MMTRKMNVASGLVLAAALSMPLPAVAQETPSTAPAINATPPLRSGRTLVVTGSGRPSGPAARRRITLETGAGQVLTLNEPATNVFVADPKVAEVRPASANSLFVFGVGPGRTTIVVLDQAGRSINEYEVQVRASSFTASEAEAAVARVTGNSSVKVVPQVRGLLVTGSVASAADAARAISVLRGYVPEGALIENQLSVRSSIQVTLRVRVIEMNRNVTRALGVDFNALGTIGRTALLPSNFIFDGATSTVAGLALSNPASARFRFGNNNINAVVQALSDDNLARILAEPNLTVMSGQPASFLAGGEFPIPIAASAGSQGGTTISLEFKKYGVSLSFVPTVLTDGRINLHVAPEVSQLSKTGAVTFVVNGTPVSIPGLLVRRAETTVELGSGQSFAIAGLLNDNTDVNTSSVPFLGDLPVLGALFRSTSFQRQETELVIIVTPYIVDPVSDPAKLHSPAERFTPPNDLERILLLRQVGSASSSVPMRIPGQAGFIVQ